MSGDVGWTAAAAPGGRLDAVVVGAGVIGLTTGICLAEAGLRVRIWAALPPHATTSALASAMIGPSFAAPEERVARWEQVTVAELTGARDIPGVRVCRGIMVARPADITPPDAEVAPGYQPCAPGELPPGYGTGFWLTVPVVDMPPYLDHLTERFAAAGGRIEIHPARGLAEAAEQAPLVANCAGLGARELAGDPLVHPLRGARVVVANPGLDTFLMESPVGEAWASVLPHGEHVVLGGSMTRDADMTPKPAEAERVLARCVELEPRLRGARIIDFQVGLRPGRPSVRLEAERIGGALCAHNYGHGGFGVTASWGCARDATALLLAPSEHAP